MAKALADQEARGIASRFACGGHSSSVEHLQDSCNLDSLDDGGGDMHIYQGAAWRSATFFQNSDYPALIGYWALLGGLLKRHFALSPEQLGFVFLGAKPMDLALV
jgi:hypothetical protein